MASAEVAIDSVERAFIDGVIAQKSSRPGELLGILEAVQEHNPYKYLSAETLRYIAERLDLPLSRLFSVATFYALFNLQPTGENTDLHLSRHRLPHP